MTMTIQTTFNHRIRAANEDGTAWFALRDILEAVGYNHMGVTLYSEDVPTRHKGSHQFGQNTKPYKAVTLIGALCVLSTLTRDEKISDLIHQLMYFAYPTVGMDVKERSNAMFMLANANNHALQKHFNI